MHVTNVEILGKGMMKRFGVAGARFLPFFVMCLAVLILQGCAWTAPVPGGTDAANPFFYQDADDLQRRLASIEEGMTEMQVFDIMGRKKDDFSKLSRQEVMASLFGSNNLNIQRDYIKAPNENDFIQSIDGYRMRFKDINREHGFSSPIRVKTKELGYDYTVDLLFQYGVLIEVPIVSGGQVNNAYSRTLFDYLSPAVALGIAQ
jgi:hypothetical protein